MLNVLCFVTFHLLDCFTIWFTMVLMKKIVVIAILALIMTSSLFAAYIGVEAGGGFNTRDIKIRNDEGEYVKRYTDDFGYLSFTAIGELMTYTENLGFGAELTIEKPIFWERSGKSIDVSESEFKIREVCAYAIFPSGIYYTATFNFDGGIYYRREALASQVGGQITHTIGAMGKLEYIFENPSFVVPKIGIKFKIPLMTYVSDGTRVITDGISLGAYLTLGFGS